MNPGSEKAREAGCNCPQLDNNHGQTPARGWNKNGTGRWIIAIGCPVHDKPEESES